MVENNRFEISRGREKAWVKTPFPVSQNVWADFVMKIFPHFQVPVEQMSAYRYEGRHLNRQRVYDELADGQSGIYYRHAYLPHGERGWSGLVAVNGMINVHDSRIFYLDQIQADLEENPLARTALLESIRHVHAETVGYLIKKLIEVPGSSSFKNVKTTKGLRDMFGKELAKEGLLDGCYNNPGEKYLGADQIDEIPFGKLPLSMKGQNVDFLRSQTCLDFLRVLEHVVLAEGELTESDLTQIPKDMKKNYSDIVKVLT